MSKGDAVDVQENIDAQAAYLRDSVVKGDSKGIVVAECQLKRCDIDLALLEVEA